MSEVLKSIHRTAAGLYKHGAINKLTMRRFDAMCLTELHEFSPEQVRALREKYHLSQPVLAMYLNVSDKLVKKWEQGDSKPKGAALKMLVIAEQRGIEAIA